MHINTDTHFCVRMRTHSHLQAYTVTETNPKITPEAMTISVAIATGGDYEGTIISTQELHVYAPNY